MENKNYIVAIDLGSSNVVVAVGSRAADGKIDLDEVVIGEAGGVAGGQVKNVESAAASIKKAVAAAEESLGVKISEAYVGISGDHIRCAKHPYYVYVAGRDGEITRDDVVKLNESMHNMQAPEGYTLMDTKPQHYIVDDGEEVLDPVGRFGKTLGSTFNLVIGENTIISRHDKAFRKVGITPARVFINALAMAEAVTFPDEKDLGVAVVDIGAGTTDVCIYQEGIVRNISVIPIGADSINRDIRSYGIMERYVEDLKVMYGCAVAEMVDGEKLVKIPGRTPTDYKDISFRNLASIIEARMLDIIDYVVEEIKEAGYQGKLGAGIILTGGSANLKEIKTLFESRTGLEVRVALPDILVTPASRKRASDPRLAAAIGMLWQGLGSGVQTKTEPGTRHNDGDGSKPSTVYDKIKAGEKVERPVDSFDEDDFKPKRKKQKRNAPADPVERTAGTEEQQEKKPKGKGFFGKLKEALTGIADLDVLDDDTMI